MKIDDDIPVPEAHQGRPPIWPMAKMQPGQSAFVPNKTTPQANNAAQQFRVRKGWRFTVRAVTEGGVKGVRVWRIE